MPANQHQPRLVHWVEPIALFSCALCMIFTILLTLFCFSSDFNETWWSCSTHVYYNFTKFHQNRMKNKNVFIIDRLMEVSSIKVLLSGRWIWPKLIYQTIQYIMHFVQGHVSENYTTTYKSVWCFATLQLFGYWLSNQ